MARATKQDIEQRLTQVETRVKQMIQETRSRLNATGGSEQELGEFDRHITQLEQNLQQVTAGGGDNDTPRSQR